jgi:hypothetical protein
MEREQSPGHSLVLGAAGEMAVASHLGMKNFLYKETQAKKGSDDLPGIDIKTRSKHSYDLIVQRNENPDKKFVLLPFKIKLLSSMVGAMEGTQ